MVQSLARLGFFDPRFFLATTQAVNNGAPPPKTSTQAPTKTSSALASRFSAADQSKRKPWIDMMTRGLNPTPNAKQRARIVKSLDMFSTKTLKRMAKSGVRFWYSTNKNKSLPPELEKAGFRARNAIRGRVKAQYVPGIRVLWVEPKTGLTNIRHEVGHLFDDLLDEPKTTQKPIWKFRSDNTRLNLANKRSQFASQTKKKYATQVWDAKKGSFKTTKMTLADMYKRRRHVRYPSDRFNSGVAAAGYADKSAHEFLAEGFAVFHSNDIYQQTLLYWQAPELFAFLKAQALAEGAPVPDEKALDKRLTAKQRAIRQSTGRP